MSAIVAPSPSPSGAQPGPSVPIGPTTVTGYSVSAAGFILALIAFLSGDRSDPTIETIVIGGVAAASFLVTQIGRYVQAREMATAAPAPTPATVHLCTCAPANGAASSGPGDADETLAAIRRMLPVP